MQMSIEFVPGARVLDPATSHAAARSARALASRHHKLILDCLRKRGPAGKDAIGMFCGLTGVQVYRRLNELHSMGRIKPTGKVVYSFSGRSEREWMAVASGGQD
jgi:hypothetical protein